MITFMASNKSMVTRLHFILVASLLFVVSVFGQDVSIYQQFNGRFDFTFVGNTLNTGENNVTPGCSILTSSAAVLNLGSNDLVEKAYLYWAGSGTGDFDVKLNNIDIVAQRTFALIQASSGMPYFSAFADVTSLVQNAGNGVYTFSDLDLNATINTITYCTNRTNFGGWAMVVVFKNSGLPLNQLNVYDGLQGIPTAINITLSSLNVIDNVDAKIGFVAWEGDTSLAVNETLKINGTTLSNALNPANNAFNSTNTETGATDLYNMDLDVYSIQNNIAIGDATATIQMTSGQDFVMVNAIITKLNSQLPDATVTVNTVETQCYSRKIKVNYTVYNTLATNPLPVNAEVAVFANGVFVGNFFTSGTIPIGGFENGSGFVLIPATIPLNFNLKLIVDSNPNGIGSITEILENNNSFEIAIRLFDNPKFNILQDITTCNLGLSKGIFDFSDYANLVRIDNTDIVQFFETMADANSNSNQIFNTGNYTAKATPKIIYVKLTNLDGCSSVTTFKLRTRNCPPKVYNAVTPNDDGENDFLIITGLYDIFMNHKLYVYNRWGQLVFEGNNNERFSGFSNKGLRVAGNVLVFGTYFYILELNDVDYPEPLNGFLFLKR